MRTRFAPTPSGYLHRGNAVHIIIVRELAKAWGADVAVRVDDFDSPRVRLDYLTDIFNVARWLDLQWQIGPSSPADVLAVDADARKERMRSAMSSARACGMPTYACICSRQERALLGEQPCPCIDAGLIWKPGVNALRIRIPEGTSVAVGTEVIDLAARLGDFVLWRRDDLPSYQVASVIADRDLGTNLLIRGDDLLDSTAAQFHICQWLGDPDLARSRVVHHRLVLDANGNKLSKSAGAQGEPLPRTRDLRGELEDVAAAEIDRILRLGS